MSHELINWVLMRHELTNSELINCLIAIDGLIN